MRVGDLRTQFQRAFQDAGPPTASDRVWTFAPALDISETYDSSTRTARGFGKDYITRVTPVLAGEVDANRLKGKFSYAPALSYYAMNANQNGVAHNLNSDLTGTIVEDLLYANLRGYASTQPILGGLNTGGGGRLEEAQSTNFTGGLFMQKRFGDLATVAANWSVTRSTLESMAPRNTPTLVAGLNQNYTSQSEAASISSGPDFGRISTALSANAMQYYGTGLYKGAHNETVTLAAGYAVTRMITVNTSIGHETIVYGPGGPKAIDGVTWSGGVKLQPNADSVINASYGRQQGGNTFSFDGTYAFGPRLRLLGRYSQGIGTGLQNLNSALTGAAVGPAGIAIDRNTGAPLQLGSLLGQQPGVYRTTIGSFTAVMNLDRDVFTFDFNHTDRQLLSGTASGGFGSSTGQTSTIAWQHQLSEAFSTNLSIQYGTRTTPGTGGGTGTTSGINLSTNYALSPTLSTNALISHTTNKGRGFANLPSRDMVVVGVHKAF